MWEEFRKFIMRGNVLDLAVGIVIGTAFTAIVNSFVNDILMPPIGLAIGGVDFSNIALTLKQATADTEVVTLNVGLFLNAIIQFLIIALAVFLLVRAVNNMMVRFEKKKEEGEVAPAELTTEEKILEAIKELTETIKAQQK